MYFPDRLAIESNGQLSASNPSQHTRCHPSDASTSYWAFILNTPALFPSFGSSIPISWHPQCYPGSHIPHIVELWVQRIPRRELEIHVLSFYEPVEISFSSKSNFHSEHSIHKIFKDINTFKNNRWKKKCPLLKVITHLSYKMECIKI